MKYLKNIENEENCETLKSNTSSQTIYEVATITGKRQITIPKKIYDKLKLENCNQVIFRSDNDTIIFEALYDKTTCFACGGKGSLEGEECFICNGNGSLNSSLLENLESLLSYLLISSLKYKVNFETYENNGGMAIRINSSGYSKETLELIEFNINNLINI